jgi:hypothetical protein
MKIFLSWSGTRSKLVAELLNDWLRCVIQAARPWISSRDIDRGALWFSEISEQLSDTGIGIVCLTAENQTKPWILFETGALAKGLTYSRVCTLLIDLQPTDVEDPLAQFNHTFPTKESMWSLIRTLNNLLQNQSLDDRTLQTVFETYWPQFETSFNEVIKKSPQTPAQPRTEDSLLKEILSNTRELASKVRGLESLLPNDPVVNAFARFGNLGTTAERAHRGLLIPTETASDQLLRMATGGKNGLKARNAFLDSIGGNDPHEKE